VLCEAAAAVTEATTNQRDHLDPQLLADLRKRYDDAVRWGITTNRHRDWAKGNHPGYNLATRLHDKADQVWTFHNVPGHLVTSQAPNDTKPSPATGTP
jgi:transposase